jgi:hypothetical protein
LSDPHYLWLMVHAFTVDKMAVAAFRLFVVVTRDARLSMSPSRPESLTLTAGDFKSPVDVQYIGTNFSSPLRLLSIESVFIVRAVTGSHIGHNL